MDWLLAPFDSSVVGPKSEAFGVIDYLCELVDLPTRIPNHLGDRLDTAHLILSSVLSLFLNDSSLVSANHCLVHFSTFFSLRRSASFSMHRLGLYDPVGWDSCVTFLSFILETFIVLYLAFLFVSSFTETALQAVHIYISYFTKLGKPQSSVWFKCA